MSKALHRPLIADEWPVARAWSRLDDVTEGVFDCPHTTPELVASGPFVVRSQDIRGRVFDWRNAGRVSEETYIDRIARAEPRYGDILYSREGTYFGIAAEVPENMQVCLGQRMVLIRPVANELDHRFLTYWLNSPIMDSHLRGFRDGSVAERLNMTTIRALPVPVLPLPEQREIAAILGALDDKIEVNRKASATLEAMARALYRSWFVDFDPVWAKLEGRLPTHMPPATAALFPDSFGDDGLPLGWEMSDVDALFDVTMGQSPPGDTYNDVNEGMPFFQGRTDFGFRFPTNRKYCSAPNRIAEAGSILLSVRAPVGDLNLALERCCIGRGVASISEKHGRQSFGLYTMWSLSEALDAYQSEGTVFGSINRNQLLGLDVIAAPADLISAFDNLTAPMDAEIRRLELETKTLAALRDSLLPKLMSSEIRVGDARAQVEEVA